MNSATKTTTIVHIEIDSSLSADVAAKWADSSWQSATVWLSPTLTRAEQLESLARAFDDLGVEHATQGSSDGAELVRKALNGPAWGPGLGIPTEICRDCDSEFSLDSSPSLDRCWSCQEVLDEEAGR